MRSNSNQSRGGGAWTVTRRIAGMIGIAPWTIFDLLLPALIIWAAFKARPYVRPLRSFLDRRTYRWTIADWFDLTFWIAVVLASVRALATL
jgi:hypothetical protein